LKSGCSEAPEVLLKKVGADITDAGFWQKGLDMLSTLVDMAETLAAQQGGSQVAK